MFILNSVIQAKQLHVFINYRNHRTVVIISIIFTFLIALVTCVIAPLVLFFNGAIYSLNPIFTPSCGVALLFILIYVLQFFLASMALNERFKLMNSYLK